MNTKSPSGGPGPSRNKRLLRLVGPLSLSILVSTGCTSDPETTSSEPAEATPGSQPANEHSCGSGCGATGCGGPKKTSKKTPDQGS